MQATRRLRECVGSSSGSLDFPRVRGLVGDSLSIGRMPCSSLKRWECQILSGEWIYCCPLAGNAECFNRVPHGWPLLGIVGSKSS